MGMTGVWARLPADEVPARLALGGFHDWIDGLAPDRLLDLDKGWHGLHATLTGTEWETEGPLGWAVLGGHPHGADTGYGPGRYLAPEVVVQVADALDAVDRTAFRAGFDPARLAALDVYPQVWDEPADDLADWIAGCLDDLAALYRAAATDGDAVVAAIT